MSWIENNARVFASRDTDYNGIALIDRTFLNHFTAYLDQYFNSLLDYSDEISSVTLFPLKQITTSGIYGKTGVLKVSKGIIGENIGLPIVAKKIDGYASYFTLGQYRVKPYFNNYADYSGYTYIKVYLPLLGFVDVDVNECMGKVLQFRLYVDYHTGKGMYIIGVSDDELDVSVPNPFYEGQLDGEFRILSTYETQIGIDIPLGSSNLMDIKRNLLMSGVRLAASLAVAPISSAIPTYTKVSTKSYNIQGRGAFKGARLKTVKSGSVSNVTQSFTNSNPQDKIVDSLVSSADALLNSYPKSTSDRVQNAGLMTICSSNIHVVIYRPKIVPVDDSYYQLYGRPVGMVMGLKDVHGYAEITSIRFEGTTATPEEISMIEEQLANGVIFPY